MTTGAAAAATAPAASRRRWTLQSRLMLTVIGIVSLILVGVAVAISAILGTVLQESLDNKLRASVADGLWLPPGFPGDGLDAYDILSSGRQEPGFLLVLTDSSGQTTGAVVGDDSTVTELTDAQIEILAATARPGYQTVDPGGGLGDYRVVTVRVGQAYGLIGLPMQEIQATIATLLTTIALVTAAGLLVLGVATAFVIRVGLRPLRAVADTATRVASLPMDRGAVSIAERVPADEADDRTETGRVGAALNTLLDHVDASLDARQRNEERMRRFVADASHELRTPLASIRGYSELSLRALRQAQGPGGPADGGGAAEPVAGVETTEASLERIQAQSLRMTTLVEDLLLLARLDEGQELVYGTVDLTRLVVEAVGDARPAGPDHGWVVDVGEDPVVVAGDAQRLQQVIANLLANARTHTPAGTTVTVSLAHEGAEAVLLVHDDGPGVDPAVADEMFERFSRADRSRARKTGGTGLGLSIAKAIVDAHHGRISARSVPGDTTFEVRLPARPA